MKSRVVIIATLLSLGMLGCYLPISGTVIDAETKRPVEGAVILVEWTKTKGIGLTNTVSYKVAETISNKDGKFDLPGCYSPFVDEPDVTIYKNDYVTWNNKFIFPERQKRTMFRWESENAYALEKFNETFSYVEHQKFTTSSINSTLAQDKKQLFWRIYNDAVKQKVIQEQEDRERQRNESLQ